MFGSPLPRLLAAATAVAVGVGCAQMANVREMDSPVDAGLNTNDLVDPVAQPKLEADVNTRELYRIAEKHREARKPAVMPPKRNVLCLSGGGNYGAYTSGVLVGWSRCGTRPEFDVVTGISTGALVAPMAFLGPAYDKQMEEFYTTLSNDDLYQIRRGFGIILSESFASNEPLVKKVEESVTPQLLKEVAAEHAKGRRLYVGTTELEGKRFIVWNMGEIATRGTEADLKLFRQVLLGSSGIPGFFPPAHIPVTVDGVPYIERHIDGGASKALFYRPPEIPPEVKGCWRERSLYGSDVYAIVAGKMYADPTPIKPRALRIAAGSVSDVIYAQTRGDLTQLFLICTLTGMNYHSAAIPQDFPAPTSSTDFDPVKMRAMFEEGVRQVRTGTVWRQTPPGIEPGECPLERYGTALVKTNRRAAPPVDPSQVGPGQPAPAPYAPVHPSPGNLPFVPQAIDGTPVVFPPMK